MKQCYGCFERYDEALDMCPICGYEEGDSPEEALHLESGQLIKNKYIIGKVLGYGGFGVTYLAWDTVLEQKVAIKEYLPSEFSTRVPGQTAVTVFNGNKSEQFFDGVDKFVEEANRLAQFRNTDGIVRIFESFTENNTAYIVMEYLAGQTLTQYLETTGKLSADEAVSLMTPIIQSLQIVHKQDIIHRDIAPDNIMVTKDGQVKLIDFGAARYATTSYSRSLTVVIKPGYSPEEQYRSRGDQGSWTDVYAVGATMYRMITGQTPPDAMERRAFFEGKKKDVLVSPAKYSDQISENQETAILNAMNVRIEDRTQDMEAFEQELNSQEEVKRKYGKIKKIDVLKWPLWTKIAIPVAACLVLTLATLFITGVIGFSSNLQMDPEPPEGMARVPSIIGKDIDKAETNCKDSDTEKTLLFLKIAGKEESDDIPADLILSQNLSAGSYATINSELKVIISAGKAVDIMKKDEDGKLAAVDVQYRTKDEAEQLLKTQGMKVKIENQSSETVEAGVVIFQNPVAGTPITAGTEVTIVVSTGSEAFDIPDVVGKTEAIAKSELSGKGLAVNISHAQNDNVVVGKVISQTPASGSKANCGDTVTITVSSGKTLIKVPNLIGKQKKTAGNELNKVELKIAISESVSSKPKDEVINQTPAAGTTLEKGSKVTITVSKGQCTVKLDARGGSVSPSSITANVGGTIKLPQTIRANYSFVGWFTSASGGNQVTSATVINGNMTVYARWIQKWVTVTYNPNGGSVSPVSAHVLAGKAIRTLPTPTKDHYDFTGWYNGSTKVNADFVVTSSITLSAQWTPKPLFNGGQWVPISQAQAAGGNIQNYKWKYSQRETTTSLSASMNGWKQYMSNWAWGNWGSWSAWSRNNPGGASDSMEVEKRTVQELNGYNLVTYVTRNYSEVREYRNYSVNGNYSGYGVSSAYGEFYYTEWVSVSEWNSGNSYSPGSYKESPSGVSGYNRGNASAKSLYGNSTVLWFVSSNTYDNITEYRTRTRSKIYTYYFEKYEDKETTATSYHINFPLADTSTITYSNKQEYVQYRPK